jgi:serine/threonine protein kinase/Tfp pilus assembly protein PilF
MVGQTLSHYRVLEQLGAGGMGVVYRAHDDRLDRDVAIKVLPEGVLADESSRRRFRKEALALSRLNHPNIETVYDFDSENNVAFLVMEYVRGVTLDRRFPSGPASEKEIARLGLQLAEGLDAAHKQGVIHRDLKPGNLMVSEDGRLKILDFGVAKLLEPSSEAGVTKSLTEDRVSGTLPYMSPEQLQNEKVDARTDVWAAGAVLYELATGRPPFPEDVPARLTDAILHQPAVPPRSINGRISFEVERIILKCLEKDPDDRYQAARELAVDLRRSITPTSQYQVQRRTFPVRRRSLVAVGAVVVLAALAAFDVGGWRERLARAGPVAHIESVAVLPLVNLSNDPGQDYFADGITEELIAALAQISALNVISRTSVMPYKAVKKPLPQIARELNVDAIVEGSVRRSGDRVRVTAQLIHAASDRHLWAKTYETDLRDVLALQDEVALAIAKEVGGKLNPQQQQRLEGGAAHAASARRVNPEAYEAYLRGSSYLDNGDLEKSTDYFSQAIRLEPDYAPPYAKLALADYELAFFNVVRPSIAFSKIKEAATKALEKDETLAEAHGALALVKLHYDWDFPGAEQEFKRALELNPNNADIRHEYSHYLMTMGRVDESANESNRAVQLDPVDTILTACLCWHRYSARQYNASVEQALKAIQMDPKLDWTHIILGWDYEQQRRFEQAIAEFQKAAELSSGSEFALAALGHAFAVAGKKKQAEEILAKLTGKTQRDYVSAFDIAVIYTGLGQKEKAFQWLQKAFEERSSFLIYSKWEPRLDPLRSDSRFQDLLRRIGLPV